MVPQPTLTRKLRLRLLIGLAVLLLMLAAVPLVGAALADPCVQGDVPTGCADVRLSDASMTADFYMGEVMVATGVNSARVNIPPSISVKIEARSIRDTSPEFGDVYTYADTSSYAYVGAGQTRDYVITPVKKYLKGFLTLTCDIGNIQTDELVGCRPLVDGIPQPDLAPGGKATYALLPGAHTVHVDLIGDHAARWNKTANDHTVNITAGRAINLTSRFQKKGLLIITLSQPTATADLYVDGVIVASQVTTTQLWVTSYASHIIEARNVTDTDPSTAGVYKWRDARTSTYLSPGQSRTARVFLVKEYLVGFLSLRCQLDGYAPTDDVQCVVAADGAALGTQKPGETARYNLSRGVHALSVTLTGTAANRWEAAKNSNITIFLGQTTYSTARFRAASTTSPTNPGSPYTATITGFNASYLRTIYQRGKALGNYPNRFSKIGDSESAADEYLSNFDTGNYMLGGYGYLSSVVTYFNGSFIHEGQAVKVGMSLDGLLDPLWANPAYCNSGEHLLACEIRTHKPSIALILMRSYQVDNSTSSNFARDLRTAVKYCLDKGVIPVLSTAPYWHPPLADPIQMNSTIRSIAAEYRVPLWDLWVTTERLPDRGVGDERGHTSIPPDRNASIFDGDYMNYGMTHRNLEALEVLHMILNQVIQP